MLGSGDLRRLLEVDILSFGKPLGAKAKGLGLIGDAGTAAVVERSPLSPSARSDAGKKLDRSQLIGADGNFGTFQYLS